MTHYVGLDVSQKTRRSVWSTLPGAGCGEANALLLPSGLSRLFVAMPETTPRLGSNRPDDAVAWRSPASMRGMRGRR